MDNISNIEEQLSLLGEDLRRIRIQKNLTQAELAKRAGISMTAMHHLESGAGATLSSMLRVLRALDRSDWLRSLAPQVTLNPLHMGRVGGARRRARKPRKRGKEE